MRSTIGRDRELVLVREFVEDLAGAAAFALDGEPGIGKTTLRKESVETGRGHGALQLLARSGPLLIPSDDCFWLYEAPSAEAVLEATRRAAIEVERVVQAVPIAADDRETHPTSLDKRR
jgi:hypothetical protein